ncbi:MAG: uncharacterized protein JWQ55_4397 [Rhodopila sp.]|nr:uncharacterized protein [Rhodopila sp.]
MAIPSARATITRVLNYFVPSDRADSPPPHTFKSDVARAEGWDIFDWGLRDDGTARIEIQRLDSPETTQPTFESDLAAWEHVVARARAGSVLHLRALQMVDPTERMLIQCFCAAPDLPP